MGSEMCIRDSFANTQLLPGVIERDENQIFPNDEIKKMGELGFMGMMASSSLPSKNIQLITLFSFFGIFGLLGPDIPILPNIVHIFMAMEHPAPMLRY